MKDICLGFITNPAREDLVCAAAAAMRLASEQGFACVGDEALRGAMDIPLFSQRKPDVLLAFGGDGTILRAVPAAVRMDTPICGVNLGRVGFLSEAEAENLSRVLAAIASGAYTVEERMLFRCCVNGEAYLSANDVLIYRHGFSGVACVHVNIDGADAGAVFCDGVIISTPMGATGYSISAGGPVIAPGVDVAVITPICPHSLAFRPIIAGADADIRFRVDDLAHLAIDGTPVADIHPNEDVRICRAEETLKFVRIFPRNLYSLIRTKLS